MSELNVRPMRRAEIQIAVDWAAEEGWNPGLHDAEAFAVVDEEGFWIGEMDGRPVSTISAVRYGSEFAFVGFYIVRADVRGEGVGLATWSAALARIDGLVAGLDAVVEQEGTYARDGFERGWKNQRRVLADPSQVATTGSTTPLEGVSLEQLVDFDQAVFPAGRSEFLDAWRSAPGAFGVAIVDGTALLGWALRRPCRDGYKIGPLFAPDFDAADALFRGLVEGVAGPIFLDVPQPNETAMALVERYDMPIVFETVRMWRGPAPDLDLERIVGITTFELG